MSQPTTEKSNPVLDALLSRLTTPQGVQYRKILVYGNPGVGKTTFAAQAPSPLILDVERGTTSLASNPETSELASVSVLPYVSLTQVEGLIRELAKKPESLPYETLVIDSFSELQKRSLDALLTNLSGSARYIPDGPKYNENTNHLRSIATRLADLNMHIVVVCHAKEDTTDSGVAYTRPDLTPKLSNSLLGIFDVVAYMTSRRSKDGTVIRRLIVEPTDNIVAKNRLGLPAQILNPTFTDLGVK